MWQPERPDADVEPERDDVAAPGFARAIKVEDVEVAPSGQEPAIVIDLARGKPISTFP